MFYSICTVICLITISIVSAQTLCPKGCICKSYGYCKDCESGYYKVNGKCKNCSANCRSCSSEYKCDECEIGYYKASDKLCLACSQGCISCSSFNYCLTCQAEYFKSDRKCIRCSSECKTCSSENVCTACFDGFGLNDTSCQSCGDGYFKLNSHCAPCPHSCHSCSLSNVCTKCKNGFFGLSCDQKCSSGCKDGVCELTNGTCTCKQSHTGKNCKLCTPGKFGPHCSLDCPKECLTCDINGRCLMCKPGYYGITCNCTNGCLNNTCDKWTGLCFRCKPFFKWPCLECVDGKYGNNCQQDCPVNCYSCSSKESCNKCDDGYNGTLCDNICKNGKCSKRCSPGFYGVTCEMQCQDNCKLCSSDTKCQLCKKGFWGKQCQNKCPKKCFDKKCNKETETCISCVDVFFGNFCNLTCSQNCFDSLCHRSGDCLTCKLGYFGKQCLQKCAKGCTDGYCLINGNCINCSTGFYGKRCEKRCPSQCLTCKNGTFCDICKRGFIGRTCTDRCSYCKNATSCNIETSHCEKCPDGMYGKRCEFECDKKYKTCNSTSANKGKCLKCIAGRYGINDKTCKLYNCNQKCSINCINNSCSADSGFCDYGCKQGYWGRYCDRHCTKNCFNNTCHKTSGTCSYGCNEGYHGYTCDFPKNCVCNKSGLCLFSCLNETGGKPCKMQCKNKCLSCNQDNGECNQCGNNTFYGLLCDKKCSDTCYHRSCESVTGRCKSGCTLGYFGDTCQKRCGRGCKNIACNRKTGLCDSVLDETSTNSSQDPSFIMLLASLVMLMFIVVVILAILAIKRYIIQRKRRAIEGLGGAVIYRNSEQMQSCENDINRRPVNILQRDNQDVLGDAAIDACEQPVQENVYVNVTEYACIERNQFPNIIEENEVEFQFAYKVSQLEDKRQSDEANEGIDEFLYANAEEYLKRRVPINQLRELVKNRTKVEYIEEFKKLPPGLIKPFHESQKAENMMKNRYKDVYPYDSKRVILKDRESDYINASFIDGYKRQKVYIASLGPTVKQMGAEFGAFWSMVWQERVCKIVMLTNLNELGVQKCDKYWPDKDVCCIYENIKVTCQSEEIYPYFTVRIFSVEKTEKRVLYQMHYTAWPDKTTPRNVHSMIDFWEKLTRIPKFELGPIIVHCSAGVGRTGTFIALDILANEGVSEGTVDIFACVRNLREDRVNLIQTVEQYRFLHEALVNLLSCHTSVKALLTEDVTVQR